MKKDIPFLPVKDVKVAVVQKDGETGWFAYLLNTGSVTIENVMVTSRGYGFVDNEPRKTSVLRHFLGGMAPSESAIIEPVDPAVFALSNEYWVSYFIGGQVYDKKFIFVPGSIMEEHLSYISQLQLKGVLHE